MLSIMLASYSERLSRIALSDNASVSNAVNDLIDMTTEFICVSLAITTADNPYHAKLIAQRELLFEAGKL